MIDKTPQPNPTVRTSTILLLSAVVAVLCAALTIQSGIQVGLGIVAGGGAFVAAFDFFHSLMRCRSDSGASPSDQAGRSQR